MSNQAFESTPIPESHLPSLASAMGGFAYIKQGGFLVIATPKEEVAINTAGRVCSFSWSPYGDKIALITMIEGTDNKNMSIYDIPTRQLENVPQYSDCLLAGVLWAPQGYYILLDYDSTATKSAFFKVVIAGSWEKVCEKAYGGKAYWSPDGKSVVYASTTAIDTKTHIKSYSLVRTDLPDGADTIIAKGTSREMYSPYAWTSDHMIIYSKLSLTNNFSPELWEAKDGSKSPSKLNDLPFPFNKNSIVNKLQGNVKDDSSIYYSWSPDKKYFGIWRNNYCNYDLYLLNWNNRALTFLGRGKDLAWSPVSIKQSGMPWASQFIGDI